jgi:hypothetical protein
MVEVWRLARLRPAPACWARPPARKVAVETPRGAFDDRVAHRTRRAEPEVRRSAGRCRSDETTRGGPEGPPPDQPGTSSCQPVETRKANGGGPAGGTIRQTIAELSEALLASRSAITGALEVLERIHAVRRSRAAGERSDRVRTDFASAQAQGFDISEFQELGDLAREGLEVLSDAPPARRADLLELAAFAEFLVEGTQALRQEWEAHRAALRASGELPS